MEEATQLFALKDHKIVTFMCNNAMVEAKMNHAMFSSYLYLAMELIMELKKLKIFHMKNLKLPLKDCCE